MNLWLDDIRVPPTDKPWVWVRTVDECIAKIKRRVPQRLSLDNDLGPNQPEGYKVLDWLEARFHRIVVKSLIPDEIFVHSANPVARARMQVVIARLKEIKENIDDE